MRKLFLSALFVMGMVSMMHAQVLLTENFDYNAGVLLSASGYAAHSGAGTNSLTVATGSLTYTGYAASGIGNSLKMVNTGEDCNKSFSTDSITTGSVYIACLAKVDTAKTGDYFIHAANGTLQGVTYGGRVYVRKANNGNLTFGIAKVSATVNSPKYADSIYSVGTTYLLVARYKFVDGALNDEVSLWINPSLTGSEPTPTVTVVDGAVADVTSLKNLCIRQGGSSSGAYLTVDGVIVSRSWIGGGNTPVELASFIGSSVKDGVQLNWATASELNNKEFAVEKMVNGAWTVIGKVAGKGTTAERSTYSFVDANVESGVQQYRLAQVDFNGSVNYSSAIEVNVAQAAGFSLDQNYPNPFNPSTQISFTVAKAGQVSLKVYNQLGAEVKELVNEVKAPGKYTVKFNASELTSGVYFYKLHAAGTTLVKKAMLVK